MTEHGGWDRKPPWWGESGLVLAGGVIAILVIRSVSSVFRTSDSGGGSRLDEFFVTALVGAGLAAVVSLVVLLIEGQLLSRGEQKIGKLHPGALVVAAVSAPQTRRAMKILVGSPFEGGPRVSSALLVVADRTGVELRSGTSPGRSIRRIPWSDVRGIQGCWIALQAARTRGIVLEVRAPRDRSLELPLAIAGKGALRMLPSSAPQPDAIDGTVRRLDQLRLEAASSGARGESGAPPR